MSEEWKHKFEGEVGGGFTLHLSRSQASLLVAFVHGDEYNWRSPRGMNNFVPTIGVLHRKGLVIQDLDAYPHGVVWKLSPAGELAAKLCIMADIGTHYKTVKEAS